MTISVVIPSYNSGKTISGCLESLIKQNLKVEIIVIDDGSSDNTQKLVQEFSQVKFLSQTHQGPGSARNLGAVKAQGEILVFVDADMVFEPNFINNLTLPIVRGKAKGTWSEEELVANWDSLWARCWNYNQNRPTAKMTGNIGQRRVFRAILKSEFKRVGGFDRIGYTDDWSLVDKLRFEPAVTLAKFYHHNPDTLNEVFAHARWIGKRRYKFGKFGTLVTIVKSNIVFSLIIGLIQAVKFRTPAMVLFKLVYDLGITLGALENLCCGLSY